MTHLLKISCHLIKPARLLAIVLALSVISGCQPLTSTVPPTAQVVHVQITPALSQWTSKLSACASSLPGIGLVVDNVPAGSLDPAAADISLRFGLPAGYELGTPMPYIPVELAMDKVVLVANPSVSISSLTPEVVAAIFSGQTTRWDSLASHVQTTIQTPTGQDIQIWSYPSGDDVRQAFDASFLQGKTMTGRAYMAPDESAMLEAIAKTPGAVGYLLASQVFSGVKVIDIEGNPSASPEKPVLALSAQEPQGQVNQFLLCLQTKAS